MREASSIEDSLFQTPAPIGDASSLAVAADDRDRSANDTHQDEMLANDGFGDDDDDVGGLGNYRVFWFVVIASRWHCIR